MKFVEIFFNYFIAIILLSIVMGIFGFYCSSFVWVMYYVRDFPILWVYKGFIFGCVAGVYLSPLAILISYIQDKRLEKNMRK